jgi:hypothetical protein
MNSSHLSLMRFTYLAEEELSELYILIYCYDVYTLNEEIGLLSSIMSCILTSYRRLHCLHSINVDQYIHEKI